MKDRNNTEIKIMNELSKCDYMKFLENKRVVDIPTGLKIVPELNPLLKDFQHDIVSWSLRRGRSCIFADCGMGKTFMQLEWANNIPGDVLIIAPLAVSEQTIRESKKFNTEVPVYSGDGKKMSKITITNYERIEKFNPSDYMGIVLDESSILKSFTGKYRNMIIDNFSNIPFRLSCTATPAPNDFMELGNQAEFVGAMTRTEMLSMFFVHDGGDTSKWRLKGHAQSEFWKWVCSWAVMITKPSDLGYSDDGYILPELHIKQITVKSDNPTEGCLFAMEAQSLQERQQARKASINARVSKAAELIEKDQDNQWLVWCDLNSESELLKKSISGSIEVKGSDTDDHKKNSMIGFSAGEVKYLVSKPSIAGLGMNFQSCHNMIFTGLSDSYEQFYQAVRRCWRFGQTKEVNCYVITAEQEGAVVKNIQRKEEMAKKMQEEMVKNMSKINIENIKGTERTVSEYKENVSKGKDWTLYLGDSCEVMKNIESDSIGYSIFSPPFASLYTYSNSDRDLGNCKNNNEFFEQFSFIVKELYRIIMPGRLVSFHCMNMPTSKSRDGYIGIDDFRGDLIRLFQQYGFIYHSEVVIWKDPVIAMQRTKALGLLHKQLVKDSAMSRQGIPDYLVTMRKPGNNQKPVSGELDEYIGDEKFVSTGRKSIDIWQRYASPVWMDINPSDTLQYACAREKTDERHICPLQLQVIDRGLQLWSLPGDIVFSPFAGIGSEGHEAIKMGRKSIGIELKQSYYDVAVKNMQFIENQVNHEQLDFGI